MDAWKAGKPGQGQVGQFAHEWTSLVLRARWKNQSSLLAIVAPVLETNLFAAGEVDPAFVKKFMSN